MGMDTILESCGAGPETPGDIRVSAHQTEQLLPPVDDDYHADDLDLGLATQLDDEILPQPTAAEDHLACDDDQEDVIETAPQPTSALKRGAKADESPAAAKRTKKLLARDLASRKQVMNRFLNSCKSRTSATVAKGVRNVLEQHQAMSKEMLEEISANRATSMSMLNEMMAMNRATLDMNRQKNA